MKRHSNNSRIVSISTVRATALRTAWGKARTESMGLPGMRRVVSTRAVLSLG